MSPSPADGADRSGAIVHRAAALAAVRAFFAQRQFVEVETPAVVGAPSQEANLDPRELVGGGWLITSPEHHMKRLLARERLERIYQICRCFRGGERSPLHRAEFTMVEWYRADADYGQIAVDVEELVAHVALRVARSVVVERAGIAVDLTPPWLRLTVAEAFAQFADVALEPECCAESIRRAARQAGCHSVDEDDDWESAFHKLFVERVEPRLAGLPRGVHLFDYPRPLAALARLKPTNPAVSERFESYAGGLELANGFSELTDPRLQRRRFREEREKRRRLARALLPVDEAFLRSLAELPPAAGVALGFDRLAMLVTGAGCIDEVTAF